MRKYIFYASIILAFIFLVRVLRILIFDLDRLTEYGYGYLVGKIILFLVFVGISLVLRKRALKSKNEPSQ